MGSTNQEPLTMTTADTSAIATTPATDEPLLALLVHEHCMHVRPALERLWEYYRNELDFTDADDHRPYRAAQEQGLPGRLTRQPGQAIRTASLGADSREVVIENDIAWRIHTLVDFMFGRKPTLQSLAGDTEQAAGIERVLNAVFDANGGISFFQDLALLGSIYGFADVLLRADRLPARLGASDGWASDQRAPSSTFDPRQALRHADLFVLETVEAPRAIPVLSPSDYRRLDAYVLHYTQQLNEVEHASFLARLVDRTGVSRGRLATVDVTELWSDQAVTVYRDGEVIEQTPNVLGRLPVVHIQNLPQPFFYEGLSEVEPLIPLQDELNTRLSDRANRVTFQSFQMYLGKGVEGFLDRPVGPGQMWMTDNVNASIEQFGGDGPSPSEETHITEIRQAMDKTSAVTPVAAGMLTGRVGNLTSENALRIVLMGLLARTEKKRITYGQGIEKLCELILHAMDVTGLLPTTPEDRRVKLHWPSPIPEDESQRLSDAKLKLEIGVPRERVLAELGYGKEEQ
jgi:hypothetical protein